MEAGEVAVLRERSDRVTGAGEADQPADDDNGCDQPMRLAVQDRVTGGPGA